jgi:hypothetical protein
VIDCADIERALLDGEPLAGAEVDAHLAGCETCRFLVDDGAPVARALAGAPPPPATLDLAGLEAAVADDVAAERGPLARLRALPRLPRIALEAAVMALASLFFYVFVRRPDWDAYPAARMAATLASLGALGVGLVWVTLRPMWLPPLPAPVVRGLALAGVLVPVILSLLPEAPSPIHVPQFSYVASGYLCFSIGMGMSLLCFLAACALQRHRHRAAGLLAALGAGMIGVIAGQIFCPVNYPLHLLTGHATIPIALALGYLATTRL